MIIITTWLAYSIIELPSLEASRHQKSYCFFYWCIPSKCVSTAINSVLVLWWRRLIEKLQVKSKSVIDVYQNCFLLFSLVLVFFILSFSDRWSMIKNSSTIQIKCHVNCHVLSDPNATRVIRVPSWLTRHSDYNTSKLYGRSVMVAFLSDPVIWNYNFTSSNNRVRNTTDASPKHDWLKFLFAM